MKHDTRKNQILASDIYNRLNDQEKRLISNESQIYAIQQYIEAKGAESNYQTQFHESMQLVTEINAEVIKKSLAAWVMRLGDLRNEIDSWLKRHSENIDV